MLDKGGPGPEKNCIISLAFDQRRIKEILQILISETVGGAGY